MNGLFRDLPPALPATIAFPSGDEPPSTPEQPDLRSPSRFLRWILRRQAGAIGGSAVAAVFSFLPGTLAPFMIGQIVDRGIRGHSPTALLAWAGALLGILLLASLVNTVAQTSYQVIQAAIRYRTAKLVLRKSVQLGHRLTHATSSGEVVAVASGDGQQFGVLGVNIGHALGAVISFGLVVALSLATSLYLGLVVLIGAPLVTFAASPLLRPLQRRQAIERSRSSELTSMSLDIVAGLRVLRGFGGERTSELGPNDQLMQLGGEYAALWQAWAGTDRG